MAKTGDVLRLRQPRQSHPLRPLDTRNSSVFPRKTRSIPSSIAIGAGTDVAIESAGIVLVRSDPRDVVRAIKLSRATYRKMIQNLVWASAYNLVAIPVAGGIFVRQGLDLPMSIGAVAMSLSTIIVAANANLLRRLNLQRAVH
jgi:cation transport ATPase